MPIFTDVPTFSKLCIFVRTLYMCLLLLNCVCFRLLLLMCLLFNSFIPITPSTAIIPITLFIPLTQITPCVCCIPTSTYFYLFYLHLPISTYIYLHLPTSAYIYLLLPTSTYIYFILKSASICVNLTSTSI